MKYIYPAIFNMECNLYNVTFPDLEDCHTCGNDLQDAIEMAEDILCLYLYHHEQNNISIPKPSIPNEIKVNNPDFISIISVDTENYKRFYENKAVKKTLTIPTWLNNKAISANINFSQLLQQAIKKELNIS